MTENIKVSEVSDIIYEMLDHMDPDRTLDEVGTVIQISDGVARIYGLKNAEANELLEFDNGVKAIVMNLEEDNVGAVLLGSSELVNEGDVAKRTGRIASIDVGEGMLGRVINPLGEPIDGLGAIMGERISLPLERKAPGVIFRQPVNEPLQTGIKAIDAMIPIGRGQRELIVGDRQTGKTSIAIDTIINQRKNYDEENPVYCIYVAIGQKGSTIANLVQTLTDYGAMPYTVIVAATASDPAAMGLFFMGATVLLEKSQRVLNALAVSPVKVSEYIAAKVISLAFISAPVALILALAAGSARVWAVLLSTVLTSVIFTLLGIIAATRINSLNRYVLVTVPIEVVCFVPPLIYMFAPRGYMRWFPLNGSIALIAGTSPNIGADLLMLLITVTCLWPIAVHSTEKMWKRLGGVTL